MTGSSARRRQLCARLGEVVDLAVEGDPRAPVGGPHGLGAATADVTMMDGRRCPGALRRGGVDPVSVPASGPRWACAASVMATEVAALAAIPTRPAIPAHGPIYDSGTCLRDAEVAGCPDEVDALGSAIRARCG